MEIYILSFTLVRKLHADHCDVSGGYSTCNVTCQSDGEQITGRCQAPTLKCCRFMCAGPGTFCLREGAFPENLGFKGIYPNGNEISESGKGKEERCPENGICVKEPGAPYNWPYQFPWPPVALWPPFYVFPDDYDFPKYWPCSWIQPPSCSYPLGSSPVEKSPGPCN